MHSIARKSPAVILDQKETINDKKEQDQQLARVVRQEVHVKKEATLSQPMGRQLQVETRDNKDTLGERKEFVKLTEEHELVKSAIINQEESSHPIDRQLLVDVNDDKTKITEKNQDHKLNKDNEHPEGQLTVIDKNEGNLVHPINIQIPVEEDKELTAFAEQQTVPNQEEDEQDQLLPMDRQLLIDIHDNKMKRVHEENGHRKHAPVNRQLSVTPPPFGSPRSETVTPGMQSRYDLFVFN